MVGLLVGWIAPFVIFKGRERDGIVEHGGHYVDEGDIGNESAKEVRSHVGHRSDQESPRATSPRKDSFGIGVSFFNEVFGAVDEVGEGVLFLHELAVFVPVTSMLLAATDVGDGVDESPVDQAQHRAAKASRHAGSVGAVTVEIERGRSVSLHTLVINKGDGDFRSVPCGGVKSLGAVVVPVKSTQDLLFLEESLSPRSHVVIEDAVGSPHRFEVEAEDPGVHFGVYAERCRVGRFVEVNLVPFPLRSADTDAVEGIASFHHHEIIPKHLHAAQIDIFTGGNHLLPVLLGSFPDRGDHEAEVGGLLVGAHEELVTPVVDAVLKVAAAGTEYPRFQVGLVGVDEEEFVREGLAAPDDDEAFGLGLVEVAAIGLVLFLEYQFIVLHGRAKDMPVDLVGAQGLGILAGVENDLVVIGPGVVAGDLLQFVRKNLAGFEVLELESVDPAALDVG